MKLKVFTRTIITLILLVFVGNTIIFGRMGIKRYFNLKEEIKTEESKICKLETKLANIQDEILRWKNNDFELEKMAREDLQMGFAQEFVYILPGNY